MVKNSYIMEFKKNPSKDLQKYKPLFFNLGLAISMGLAVMAFEWKTYDDGDMVALGNANDDFEELLDIPPTVQPPPPPPKEKLVELVEIPDEEEIDEEIEIDLDIEITEEMEIEELIVEQAPEEEEADEIFTIVEQKPEPVIGYDEYYRYIVNNLKYPPVSRRMGLEGKVFVQFIVDKEGNIMNPEVVKGIYFDIDAEAVRVIKEGPKWNPGKQRGRAVKVRIILPINFTLGGA